MTITPTILTRAAGLSPPSPRGLLFIAVQVSHPYLDATTSPPPPSTRCARP